MNTVFSFRYLQCVSHNVVLGFLLAASTLSYALTPIPDGQLSDLHAQDGITVSLSGTTTASSISLINDAGTANATSLDLVDLAITDFSGAAHTPIALNFDASSTQIGLTSSWNNIRLRTNKLTTGGVGNANSFGQMVVDINTGQLQIVNRGILNSSVTDARFNLTTNGDVFYRQGGPGTPELSMSNFNFGFGFTDAAGAFSNTGTIGVNATGLFLTAPNMNFDLNFEMNFHGGVMSGGGPADFDKTERTSVMLFGWSGGIESIAAGAPMLAIGGGGISPASNVNGTMFDYDGTLNNNKPEGIHLLGQWNYSSNFAWVMGEAVGDKVQVRFSDWKRLGSAPYDFRMPLYVDVIRAADAPGGICTGGNIASSGALNASGCSAAGGTMQNLAPDVGSQPVAIMIRDGRLHAYNSLVTITDDVGSSDSFRWALGYTFGKLDGNFYLYPEGFGGTSTGLKADINVAIQSPGYWANRANATVANWSTNTHFFIGDTNTAVDVNGGGAGDSFAIGLLNADLFVTADDLYMRLINDPAAAGYSQLPKGMWLQAPSGLDFHLRGLFGGGDLEDLSSPVRISLWDINLDTDNFVFAIGPPVNASDTHMSFGGVLDLNSNSYISFAEPSRPDVEFVIDDISGRIAWTNGTADLRSSGENGGAGPSLTIDNDILIGATAGGDHLRATLKLGADALTQIAIPTGQWHSTVTLRSQ